MKRRWIGAGVGVLEMWETSRESPSAEGEHQTQIYLDYSFVEAGVSSTKYW